MKENNKNIRTILNGIIQEYLDNNLLMPLKQKVETTKNKKNSSTATENSRTANIFRNPEVFKNDWVIHFTDAPFKIIENGFKGVDKEFFNRIWRTYRRSWIKRTYNDSYAFAFDPKDIKEFREDYAQYAIVFRTSGLKVYNPIDWENQIVFKNTNANLKECFVLYFEQSERESKLNTDCESYFVFNKERIHIINPYTKKTIYETDNNIQKVMDWIKTNYRQYSGINGFKYKTQLQNQTKEKEKIINDIVSCLTKHSTSYLILKDNPTVHRQQRKTIDLLLISKMTKKSYIGIDIDKIIKKYSLVKVKNDFGSYYKNDLITLDWQLGFGNLEDYWLRKKKKPLPEFYLQFRILLTYSCE